jgi:hypothetical protein
MTLKFSHAPSIASRECTALGTIPEIGPGPGILSAYQHPRSAVALVRLSDLEPSFVCTVCGYVTFAHYARMDTIPKGRIILCSI